MMHLITAATTPVLFSSLSRLQNDEVEFRRLFFKFQKLVGILVIPLGMGIFSFSDLITDILLGDQWSEISKFVGLWGLTSSIMIIYSHYSSEVYRAKGRPKLSVLSQWLHIIVLWPTVIISIKYGFETLYTARALVRFEGILVNMIIMYFVIHISALEMIKNTFHSLVAAATMLLIAWILRMVDSSFIWQIISVILCAIVYFGVIILFKDERVIVKSRVLRRI